MLRKGTQADTYIPIGDMGEGKVQELTYTGRADNNQAGVTSATFVIAAALSTQSVTVSDISQISVGELVQIGDGTRKINGTVTAISGSVATVRTDAIVSGSAGNTMSTAATITPLLAATFTLAAAGSSQTVQFGSSAAADQFAVGDTITVADGTDSVIFLVTARSGAYSTLQTTTISTGTAGDTIGGTGSAAALVTSTSGDRILFGLIPPYVTLLDAQVVCDTANTSVTVKLGYFAQDGSEYSHLADLIVASTALATATRIRANGIVPPPTTDKYSYLAMTIGGGLVAAATTFTVILTYRYNGTP